jgi:PPOX class probable F420-dependent enzyme
MEGVGEHGREPLRYDLAMNVPDAAEALLREARVARLATVDTAGRPHVVPICFVFSDATVYSVLDAKPKSVPVERLQRVRNILANPHVQLLIDRYDEDWSRLAFVQLRGVASLLQPGPEQGEAVRLLRAKYAQYAAMELDAMPVIKVAIERAVVWGDLGL